MTMTYCKGCHIHSHSHSHGHIHSHGHSHSHGHDHQHSHSHSHGRIPGGVFSLQNRRHIDTIVGHTLQSIIRRIVEKLHDGVCEYGHHFTVFGSGLPFIDDQRPLLKVLAFQPHLKCVVRV